MSSRADTHCTQNENKQWRHANSQMSGPYVSDIFSFGGIVNASRNDFGVSYSGTWLAANFNAHLVLIDNMSTDLIPRYRNGHLGVIVSQNASQRYPNIFSNLWDSKYLQYSFPKFHSSIR